MTSAKSPTPSGRSVPSGKRGRRSAAHTPPEPTGGVSIENSDVRVGRDFAGRDINHVLQVLVNLPKWVLFGIFGMLGIGLLLLTLAIGPGVLANFREPPRMNGFFNVAIAEFGELDEQGRAVRSDAGVALSESIFNRVSDELAPFQRQKFIEVRGQGVGRVEGSEDEWDAAARQLAEKHNAHLIVYGNIERLGGRRQFVPKFYISPGYRPLSGAAELLGPSRLGSPVAGTTVGPSNVLDARTKALALFTIGLVHLADKDPDQAANFLTRAKEIEHWEDREGKEVIYLFLGTTYARRKGPGDLDRAREAYATAARLNPEYARAYIGLGNVALQEFDLSGRINDSKLEEAEDEYSRAATATDKSAAASIVDAKVHVGLGTVHLVKAQIGELGGYTKAEGEYRLVTSEYEGGKAELRALAAYAYFGLGFVQEMRAGDRARSAEYYRKSLIANADDDEKLAQLAQTRLQLVEPPGTQTGVRRS
jgi:tetratricopeptide (TPR) repeat protein